MGATRSILPFLWLHGEDESRLREEIAKIAECDVGAFCVESRPHPDFGGPLWWRDLDIVMDEARSRSMRVWLLDDSHFPSGYANGLLKGKYPERAKRYLACATVDACGPMRDAAVPVAARLARPNPFGAPSSPGELIAVVACRRSGLGFDSPIELSASIEDGLLRWDVPEGVWRLFIVYETSAGGGNPDYVNPVDRESAQVLIEAVYEPHYERYKADFGHTFAGFFSDEPSMGNTQSYAFDEDIGRKLGMVLPWSAELRDRLRSSLGADFPALLPFLWAEGEEAPRVRYAYMDIASELYAKNFSGQLGDWCRERGVEYIGHVIEDNGEHARLGQGCGHYFRAVRGQDWAGVDVVIQQVLPGLSRSGHAYFGGEWNGEFFHFGLAKLGSSLAHIDPGKKGRALCEIFGAYGWSEGTKLMKWLVDHMLVRGINRLVPHAFDPKDYPDFDCPPHFYARGHNPQFRFFGELMRYAGRLCELFDGGRHSAPVAILYHAGAEWCGEYMPFEAPARIIAEAQIDYDIVPEDILARQEQYSARLVPGSLLANGEEYRALVVPYARCLPAPAASLVVQAAKAGVAVVLVDAAPEKVVDASGERKELLDALESLSVVAKDDIARYLKARGAFDIETATSSPNLRYYRYAKDTAELFMFFNEDPSESVSTKIELPGAGPVWRYDPFADALSPEPRATTRARDRLSVDLELSPYESRILVVGEPPSCLGGSRCLEPQPRTKRGGELRIEKGWKLSFASALDYPSFSGGVEINRLIDISRMKPSFAGTIRYEAKLRVEPALARDLASLELDEAYESVELWLNGVALGSRICPPYRFPVGDALKPGANDIRIEVTTNLAREQSDFFSGGLALEPVGFIGKLCYDIARSD